MPLVCHVPLTLTEPSNQRHQLDTGNSLLPINVELFPGTPEEWAFVDVHGVHECTLRVVDPRGPTLLGEIHSTGMGFSRISLAGVTEVLPAGKELTLIFDQPIEPPVDVPPRNPAAHIANLEMDRIRAHMARELLSRIPA